MPKDVSSFELAVDARHKDVTLTRWLHEELRRAILDGRLRPGTRLPATRDFARQYGVSRGTAVTVFEQLLSDGYLRCQVGSGTWVNELLSQPRTLSKKPREGPPIRPAALEGIMFPQPARPFRLREPAMAEFPADVWARVASRRMRRLSTPLLVGGGPKGYEPLREAIADYLGSVRGVKCCADQIAVTTGVQEGLDLLARLLLEVDDPVWMEDPGYFGATIAFQNAGAKIVPIPVDQDGMCIPEGPPAPARVKCAYVTPAHQFPLGTTMSMKRRLQLLAWAAKTGAFVIEDDYDSEFRFEGRPMPALQSLDTAGSVILLGTFNKLLFPSIQVGYAVLPPSLVDRFLQLRCTTNLNATGLVQAILCDFIVDGHLGRHLRRMRQLYGERLAVLLEGGRRYLAGALDISPIQAGLYTAGFLTNGMNSQQAEAAASAHGVETLGLHRFTLGRAEVHGFLLGFAAFNETQIRDGLVRLAGALDGRRRAGVHKSDSRRASRN